MARETEFAQMLTEAVRQIGLREDKLLGTVQDELGQALGRKGGSAIEFWRKGRIPFASQDIEILAGILARRGGFERPWVERFLTYADYPYPSKYCDRLFLPEAVPQPNSAVLPLPGKSYQRLVGRENLVSAIVKILLDPEGKPAVTIDGMGGIGKTALAREALERCLEAQRFDAGIWLSSTGSSLSGAAHGEQALLTFETVLNSVGNRLGNPEILQLPLSEKESRARALLQNYRVLIVLDNLDTAAEPQEKILQQLLPLLGRSKALLTSRRRLQGEAYAIHLTGLEEADAIKFIRQEARERGVSRVASASAADLSRIAGTTGGSPLAIKLVVSLLGHLPLATVLKRLQTAHPLESGSEEDDFARFYKFIYLPSWDLLSEPGRQLLIAMAYFAPGVGGTNQDLRVVSDLLEDTVYMAIDELWKLSLLEVDNAASTGLAELCYYLHPLTHYFVMAEILALKQPQ